MATKASTRRSNEPVKSPGPSETEQGGRSEAVRELVVDVARIQLASITAASRFVTGWVQSADRYAQAISDEVVDRMHGETPPGQLIGRLAAVSSAHLREFTALPAVAVSHFEGELTKRAVLSAAGKEIHRV